MANVLDNLANDIFKAVQVVGVETTGAITGATLNADDSERVALGGIVRSAFAPEVSAVDVAPSMTLPEGVDQTISNRTATISKSKSVQIPMTGEDVRTLRNGAGFETVQGQQVAQAMRALRNEVEADAQIELALNASRAFGVARTTPFASNHNAVNGARQILADNGCPMGDGLISLVLGSNASLAFRNLGNLYKVNEAGTDTFLRQGVLNDISGIAIRETQFAYSHTASNASGKNTNGVRVAGDTAIVTTAGTGTWDRGDILSFASHDQQYVVAVDSANTTTVALQEIGLREGVPTGNAITNEGNYTSNVMFHQSAFEIIMRPPAKPDGGDASVDSMIVQDPNSGLVFEVSVYKGYKKMMIDVALAWGVKAWQPKYIANLIG